MYDELAVERKTAKQATKAGLVEGILGYQPAAHVGIDYVEPLGDWKIAWDHILFRGFLGTQMSMQFTWQGADSILTAPWSSTWLAFAIFVCGEGMLGSCRPWASSSRTRWAATNTH